KREQSRRLWRWALSTLHPSELTLADGQSVPAQAFTSDWEMVRRTKTLRPGDATTETWRRKPMNIHEYQAKQLLRRYGVPVPRGDVAHNPAEAETIAEELDGPVWVVKAQIHAGGRGKAGGVKICR